MAGSGDGWVHSGAQQYLNTMTGVHSGRYVWSLEVSILPNSTLPIPISVGRHSRQCQYAKTWSLARRWDIQVPNEPEIGPTTMTRVD